MTSFRPMWSPRPSQRAFWFVGWMVVNGIGAGLGATQARASSAAEAEAVRLDEEMRKFAQRNIWDAVDSSYARLRGLESKGVDLSAEQHELGAQAARELGRMREARARYRLAMSTAVVLAEQARLTSVLEDIDNRYGRVELAAASRVRRDAQLVMVPPPFAADARAAISHANAEIRMTGGFNGLLPVGEYTLGATSFIVADTGGVVRAEAIVAEPVAEAPQKEAAAQKPKPKPEPKPEREKRAKPPKEPAAVGLASGFYTAVGGGSATWLSRSSTAGIYVPAGTGASVRVAGGGMWSVGSVAIVAELAWDGLYGSGGAQTA
ncbi:MAG TPA: hypothetical protein DFR83_09570, partial [Deltaproteobacteria bacterium]|nr:hypothetical protein [Deltaproteobacteria bacterium]